MHIGNVPPGPVAELGLVNWLIIQRSTCWS